MDESTYWAIGISLLVGLVLLLALKRQRSRAKRLSAQYLEMEGEEERMFSFLHDLGLAIGREPTDGALSRMIVDGVLKVVGAGGGAIYYESSDVGFLNPSYISEKCPPLVGLPDDVLVRAQSDPRALESHLRLARVPLGEGLIGHGISLAEAVHVRDLREYIPKSGQIAGEEGDVSVMLSPLRYAGKDIGVLAVTRLHSEGQFSKNDFAVFRSVAEQSSFAIGNARVHRDANEKKAIEGELKNAAEVQRVLLPKEDPVVAGFRVNGTNIPARIISGDYYDYIELQDGRLGVVVADVSGKGVSAGLLMAMCRSLLRAVSLTNASPSAVLGAVNRYIFPDIREDMFISMIYGILEPADGTMTFTRAGHEPALIYRKASREVEVARPKGLALGIDAGGVFERVTQDMTVKLESGDCVLLFTDGVKEALNEHDEEFGLERVAETFQEAAKMGAEAVVTRVQEAVNAFTCEGAQMDDVTIVAIEKR
ncbi:MAG: SpoIIE family protein phosphatase [Akkermansiaceae bacterium]|jgi:phosphoserine phosphatase RsbU/P|nr:SpoIIE family protein phosphatase [Akkermansiaceae bacterium]MDP4648118.1 SpoIIE family protein phosphatase [Akkermansiaceae bacterium]MDP4719668.1 SpoIIE family protein phosphatase [Akkermansiaceae bacterium]MDP4780612.1 SpoIIE family protein phosphatase [Akkermansiaceae bacterium]MDP4846845.1 SpoIIE family protein phosphatase [Akkermansiaceae bacterium]